MDTMLRIQVRIAARQAQAELAAIASQVAAVNAASVAGASAASASAGRRATSALSASRSITAAEKRRDAYMKGVWKTQTTQFAAEQKKQTAAHAAAVAAQQAHGIKMGTHTRDPNGMVRELGMLERGMVRVTGVQNQMRRGMIASGKDMQWVGRQLNFNFTIPLALASGAALSWALDVERAFTRIRKVYGDGDLTPFQEGELDKIETGIRLLSDLYGVAQSEVAELAAEYAATGAEGAALLKSVETGLKAQILGDFDALGDVFSGLIVIQEGFNLSAGQMAQALANLNTVENITAASMPDLIEGFEKSASTAQLAGVTFGELAGMIAALVPAVGSASEAGTSIKTILARLVDPTEEMKVAMRELGVEMESAAWTTLSGTERLMLLGETLEDLTDTEAAYYAAQIAGARQVNRFIGLTEEMIKVRGRYQTVIDAIDPSKDAQNMARANAEIQTLLESDPRKLEIVTNQIKNLMIDAVLPMIPALIGLVGAVRDVFAWFNNLDPSTQRMIGGFLALVVAIGIFAQVLGSVQLLLGTFVKFVLWAAIKVVAAWTASGVAATVGFLGPMGVAIVAAIAIFVALGVAAYVFRDEIGNAFSSAVSVVGRAFSALPSVIRSAMQAALNVVISAVRAIRDWLSWINPFARHSPSLVDNVKAGTAVIAQEYAKLSRKMSVMQRAADNLKAYAAAVRELTAAQRESNRESEREAVRGVPGGLESLAALHQDLDDLNGILVELDAAIISQQGRVDAAEGAYRKASHAADYWAESISRVQDEISRLESLIDGHRQNISDLADTPIAGMGEVADKIFENEMAQKALRLEMLRMEDAGESYDDVRDRISKLNGDIEMIRSTMATLREGGAGSDVLSAYDDQLASLEAQKDAIAGSSNAYDDLQSRLDDLARQGEILDLESSINFDPMLREIDKLVNAREEMSFEDILAAIREEQAAIELLNPALQDQVDLLAEMEVNGDRLNAIRDEAQAAMEAEQAALSALSEEYREVEERIRAIEAAIRDAVSAYETLSSAAADTAGAGGGGSGVGGGVGGGGAGGAGGFEGADFDAADLDFGEEFDIDSLIEEWTEAIEKGFGEIDVKAFLDEMWGKFTEWWSSTAVPGIKGLIGGWIDTAWQAFNDGWRTIWANVMTIWDSFLEIVRGWMISFTGWFVEKFVGLRTDVSDKVSGTVDDIVEFYRKLPGRVATELVNFVTEINKKMTEVKNKTFKQLFEMRDGMQQFFTDLPGNVIKWLGDIPGKISGKGKEFITGLTDGAKNAIPALSNFFSEIPNRVVGWVGIVLRTLFTPGVNIIGGLLAGAVFGFTAVRLYVTTIPQMVRDAIPNPLTILYWVGRNVAQGFLDGLRSLASTIQSTITSFIPGQGSSPTGSFSPTPTTSTSNSVPTGARSLRTVRTTPTSTTYNRSQDAAPTNNNFYGKLEFPNIKSGDDAEEFINNLKVLAS